MNKYTALLLLSFAMGASAATTSAATVEAFLQDTSPKSASLNCAYRGKTATRKCDVTQTTSRVANANSVVLNTQLGKDANYELLTIKWPDGDVGRFALLNNHQVLNLSNNKMLSLRQTAGKLDLKTGLVLQQNGEEHTRLW